MLRKNIVWAFAGVLALSGVAADVDSVLVRQQWPWESKVFWCIQSPFDAN